MVWICVLGGLSQGVSRAAGVLGRMLLDPLIFLGPFIGEESWGWLHKRSEKPFYVVYWLGEFANNSPRTRLKGELSGDSRPP